MNLLAGRQDPHVLFLYLAWLFIAKYLRLELTRGPAETLSGLRNCMGTQFLLGILFSTCFYRSTAELAAPPKSSLQKRWFGSWIASKNLITWRNVSFLVYSDTGWPLVVTPHGAHWEIMVVNSSPHTPAVSNRGKEFRGENRSLEQWPSEPWSSSGRWAGAWPGLKFTLQGAPGPCRPSV